MHIYFLHNLILELTSYDLPKWLDNVAFILGNHIPYLKSEIPMLERWAGQIMGVNEKFLPQVEEDYSSELLTSLEAQLAVLFTSKITITSTKA